MHTDTQQLWLSWGRGEIDDDCAQAAAKVMAAAEARAREARRKRAAEAAEARKQAGQGRAADRPQDSPAAFSDSRRGIQRDKVFGPGRCAPLDRNAKVRVMMLARALMRRQEKGKAYGQITAKALAVLAALLWRFHNAGSGKCFPSYEAIAEAAACSRTSVYLAIRALEQVGVLSWVNRIKRVREYVPGLFGKASAWRWRVIRTSNAYVISDPLASKFNFQTETTTQEFNQEKLLQNVGHCGVGSAVNGALVAPETGGQRRLARNGPPGKL